MLYPAELRGLRAFIKQALKLIPGFYCLCAFPAALAADLPGCFPKGGFAAEGVRDIRGKDMVLASGDVLLSAGLYIPASVSARAEARLRELGAAKLRYAPLTEGKDRYGRIPAEIATGTPEQWLQGTLVEEGLALVALAPAVSPCRKDLLALEQAAEKGKAGLWSLPKAILQTDDTEALQQAAGRLILVEGRVTNIAARDYAAFLNFGSRRMGSFSALVRKKDLAAFEQAHSLKSLQGKTVRMRGVLQAAPLRMTLETPEALAILP